MKKLLNKILYFSMMSLMICSCSCRKKPSSEIVISVVEEKSEENESQDEIIIPESTLIQTNKTVEELKDDPKMVMFAFLYKLKREYNTFVYKNEGNVKAKVLFINYNVDFSSTVIKNGSYFYARDKSTSTFQNVDSIYYNDNKKIAFTKDLSKYTVMSTKEYHKTSHSLDQDLLFGYILNEESILEGSLLSSEDGKYTFHYVFDNEKATHYIKLATKDSGGLSDYPTFEKSEMDLTLLNDFTPIGAKVDSIYTATRPLIGTGRCTQVQNYQFVSVNEPVEIENEDFYRSLIQ